MNALKLAGRYSADAPRSLAAGCGCALAAVACQVAAPRALTAFFDIVVEARRLDGLWLACVAIAALAIGSAGFAALQALAFATHVGHILKKLRGELYHAYRDMSFADVLAAPRGALVSTIVGDAEAFAKSYRSLLGDGLVSATRLLGALVLVGITYPPEVTAAFVMASAVQVGFGIGQRSLQRRASANREAHARLVEVVAEVEATTIDVLVHDAVSAESKRVQAACDDVGRSEWRMALVAQAGAIATTAHALIVALIYFKGGTAVADAVLTVGDLVALTRYVQLVQQPATVLMSVAAEIRVLEACAGRLQQVLARRQAVSLTVVSKPGPRRGAVSVDGVTLIRRDGSAALRDVSFQVRPGEVVAIVGPSGAGKTSLARLLVGIETPTSGSVFLDDVSLAEIEREERARRVSAVFQAPAILAETLRDNITLGQPFALDLVEAAATRAGLADLMHRHALGLDVKLGRGGVQLSTGEAMRLSLARAILKQPDVLILDEFTSALDPQLEALLWREHMSVARSLRSTVIAITHSVPLARACDRIVVLSRGSVVGTGQHDGLVRSCAEYRALVSHEPAARTSESPR